MTSILIVDDDPSVPASLALVLGKAGFDVKSADGPAEALAALRAGGPAPSIDLVLQDMNFTRETSGDEGLRLLEEIKTEKPSLPVILMTAWGSIPLAVEGMKRGAADFVTKPWSNTALLRSVETALGLAAARAKAAEAGAERLTRDALDDRYDFSGLVGDDAAFLRVLDTLGRVAATDAPILILGESGTGKELIADAIHRNSKRRERPFVKVNLGGVPPSLFESEMFGHVKGAFTDARADRKGRFEAADGGTIFLDEIGDLDPASQVKMLRVLQDKTFEPLGSSTPRTVDVRVVAATNRPIEEMVASGAFREDLLYRLNLITVRVPALRERPGDIALLVRRFLGTLSEANRRNRMTATSAAVDWLKAQRFPGNVRQLRHLLERTVLLTPKDVDVLDAKDLEAHGGAAAGSASSSASASDSLPAVGAMTLDEIEKAMIEKSLRFHQGNVSRTAESLGMSRPALYRRIERYSIAV